MVSVGGVGSYSATVTDASVFAKDDTVLLIQMKGAIINVPESGSYGGYRESAGRPGAYEFLIVESSDELTDVVVFTSGLTNSYDITGMVQLISVPFYNSAKVTSNITCQIWDSTAKTGGVVAFIVGGTLSLYANIDVSGKGLMGGTPVIGNGTCTITNPALYDKFGYADSYLNSGNKGEDWQSEPISVLAMNLPYFLLMLKGKEQILQAEEVVTEDLLVAAADQIMVPEEMGELK
ncbi:MAG: hypothetical protein IPJ37_15025 [Bacteroidales bacterium]|nr:hypothetical protein [Bacteroidales bacterium]